MSYPVWDVPLLGSGLVVAIIAIIHVLISHLAIGGGAFLLVAEAWAARSGDEARLRGFLHQFGTFFLVYTTVFGAMTGVGIWFSIQLANPEATSLLIHQFVFAWATEWVTFLGELSVLYLYYYGFGHNSRAMQVFLAGAYFVIAWFSLFIINGILTFMLTPGGWTLANRDVAAGFFNPGYAPALLMRTVLMFLLAGLAGILVATRLEDGELKARVMRFAAKWVVPAALFIPPLMLWYWATLPPSTVKLVLGGVAGIAGGKLEIITRHLWLAGTAGGLAVLGTIVVALRPRAIGTGAAIALLLIVQIGIMGAEFFREMGRKPYVVHGVLYSNALWKAQEGPALTSTPFLSRARWRPPVAPGTREHGEWVFRLQCASCHTRDGYRAMTARTAAWTPAFGFRFLETLDAQGVMPPFQGTADDRAALTAYLLSLKGVRTDGPGVLAAAQHTARPAAAAPASQEDRR
ncbi:MAG TPA: cytochrome c [Polyangia bacterium]|jgi:mono/diheme cytochrome c family protein